MFAVFLDESHVIMFMLNSEYKNQLNCYNDSGNKEIPYLT